MAGAGRQYQRRQSRTCYDLRKEPREQWGVLPGETSAPRGASVCECVHTRASITYSRKSVCASNGSGLCHCPSLPSPFPLSFHPSLLPFSFLASFPLSFRPSFFPSYLPSLPPSFRNFLAGGGFPKVTVPLGSMTMRLAGSSLGDNISHLGGDCSTRPAGCGCCSGKCQANK